MKDRKIGKPFLANGIVNLLLLIWTIVKVPSAWLHCNITCLFKKGLMSNAANYRGLSIGANMSRIIAKIIMNRLKSAYEQHIGKEQYGFRQNRSTTDGIFILQNIIDKYGVYIDLTAAYDHVPRDFLFRVLNMRTGAHHSFFYRAHIQWNLLPLDIRKCNYDVFKIKLKAHLWSILLDKPG